MDNPELGRLILKQAETEPHSFSMAMWSNECGTIACLAGHAMLLSGYFLRKTGADTFFVNPADGFSIADPGGEAQRLLGMTDAERYQPGRNCLFFSGKPGDIFHMRDDGEALAEFRQLVDAS